MENNLKYKKRSVNLQHLAIPSLDMLDGLNIRKNGKCLSLSLCCI